MLDSFKRKKQPTKIVQRTRDLAHQCGKPDNITGSLDKRSKAALPPVTQ